ncbi:MAG: hypothetical protein KF749_04330 [Bacteroidetes bacterium]|nr:hypothetical protein [Bacteroidota bacterium]MCW5897604.1 hypothetical protein [Bacteroidota bacterium]
MLRTTHLHVLLLLLLCAEAYSSSRTIFPLSPPEQFFRFQRWTVNEGLSQGSIGFVHQDKTGFLWFGTAGGFDRFDGIEFKSFASITGIPVQPVYFYSCIENSDSTFWLSTDVGLILFDPVTGSGELFTPPVSLTQRVARLSALHLTRLQDGSMLFGISGIGVVRFDTNSRSFALVDSFSISRRGRSPDVEVAGVVPLENGDAYIATNDHLLLYDGKSKITKRLAAFGADQQAQCLLFDLNPNVLLIGTGRGLLQYVNGSLTPELFSGSQPLLRNASVTALFRDSKGMLWIGMDIGLAAYHSRNNSMAVYVHDPTDASSVMPGAVLTITEDHSHNLWVGIRDQGVCKLDLKPRRFFSFYNHPRLPRQIPSSLVWALAVDRRNRLWIAGGGLTTIDRANGIVMHHNYIPSDTSTRYAHNTRRVYVLDDSTVCLIANRVVYLYNTNRNKAEELVVAGHATNDVYRLLIRSATGTVICVSSDSVFEVDPKRRVFVRTLFALRRQALVPESASISTLMEEGENVWIGTNGGLLLCNLRDATVRLMTDAAGSPVNIPQVPILSLALEGPSTLWIGSQSGLYVHDATTRQTHFFGIRDGMPNEKIWCIQPDRNNSVWIGTNRGLTSARRAPDGTIRIRNYTVDDGLLWNEFGMGMNAIDSAGTLYFGMTGLLFFSPDSLHDNPNAPTIALTGLSFYGEPVKFERDISTMKSLTIPFEQKVWSVRFAGLEFTYPHRNRYAYKLEGHDDNWTEAGTRREAFYTNLDPGTYSLLIKASNNDGVWADTPLAVRIEIVPPFWMTWWFRGIAVMVLLGTFGGGVRYYELRKIRQRLALLEQERALERERARISRTMHDELGASLTSISVLSEIAKRGLSLSHEAQATIQKISDTARHVVGNLDEIVWAVNPKNDTLDSLAAYIAEYVERYFELTQVKCRFDFPGVIPPLPLTAEVRHNTFLVIKEALTNVLKYAGATTVRIGLCADEESFELSIQDDGKGFSMETVSRFSNGITNMKRRIEEIGGRFEIHSQPAKGTIVKIRFSFSAIRTES